MADNASKYRIRKQLTKGTVRYYVEKRVTVFGITLGWEVDKDSIHTGYIDEQPARDYITLQGKDNNATEIINV